MSNFIDIVNLRGSSTSFQVNCFSGALHRLGNHCMTPANYLFKGITTNYVCRWDSNKKQAYWILIESKKVFERKGCSACLKVALAIVFLIPLTILGFLLKGGAFLSSQGLKKFYDPAFPQQKSPNPCAGRANIAHVTGLPSIFAPYSDYKKHLYYSKKSQPKRASHSLFNVDSNATPNWSARPNTQYSTLTIQGRNKKLGSLVIQYDPKTTTIGHLHAFLYVHIRNHCAFSFVGNPLKYTPQPNLDELVPDFLKRRGEDHLTLNSDDITFF